jgi:F-type H+-transporting ATPase subunit delta
MADRATLARPYARAAFAHAVAGSNLAQWSEFLRNAALAVNDERIDRLIGNPRVASAALTDLLADVTGVAQNEAARNFLRLLSSNNRLDLLPDIAEQYQNLKAEREHTVAVEVISAVTLSAEQQQQLTAALTRRLQRTVHLQCRIDPELLGGAVIKAGDLVIDGSLRGKVEKLGQAILN